MNFLDQYAQAFPTPDSYGPLGEFKEGQEGLTKREYFAGVALKAIMQNQKLVEEISDSVYPKAEVIADTAVEWADALIKRLNREKGKTL